MTYEELEPLFNTAVKKGGHPNCGNCLTARRFIRKTDKKRMRIFRKPYLNKAKEDKNTELLGS